MFKDTIGLRLRIVSEENGAKDKEQSSPSLELSVIHPEDPRNKLDWIDPLLVEVKKELPSKWLTLESGEFFD